MLIKDERGTSLQISLLWIILIGLIIPGLTFLFNMFSELILLNLCLWIIWCSLFPGFLILLIILPKNYILSFSLINWIAYSFLLSFIIPGFIIFIFVIMQNSLSVPIIGLLFIIACLFVIVFLKITILKINKDIIFVIPSPDRFQTLSILGILLTIVLEIFFLLSLWVWIFLSLAITLMIIKTFLDNKTNNKINYFLLLLYSIMLHILLPLKSALTGSFYETDSLYHFHAIMVNFMSKNLLSLTTDDFIGRAWGYYFYPFIHYLTVYQTSFISFNFFLWMLFYPVFWFSLGLIITSFKLISQLFPNLLNNEKVISILIIIAIYKINNFLGLFLYETFSFILFLFFLIVITRFYNMRNLTRFSIIISLLEAFFISTAISFTHYFATEIVIAILPMLVAPGLIDIGRLSQLEFYLNYIKIFMLFLLSLVGVLLYPMLNINYDNYSLAIDQISFALHKVLQGPKITVYNQFIGFLFFLVIFLYIAFSIIVIIISKIAPIFYETWVGQKIKTMIHFISKFTEIFVYLFILGSFLIGFDLAYSSLGASNTVTNNIFLKIIGLSSISFFIFCNLYGILFLRKSYLIVFSIISIFFSFLTLFNLLDNLILDPTFQFRILTYVWIFGFPSCFETFQIIYKRNYTSYIEELFKSINRCSSNKSTEIYRTGLIFVFILLILMNTLAFVRWEAITPNANIPTHYINELDVWINQNSGLLKTKYNYFISDPLFNISATYKWITYGSINGSESASLLYYLYYQRNLTEVMSIITEYSIQVLFFDKLLQNPEYNTRYWTDTFISVYSTFNPYKFSNLNTTDPFSSSQILYSNKGYDIVVF